MRLQPIILLIVGLASGIIIILTITNVGLNKEFDPTCLVG